MKKSYVIILLIIFSLYNYQQKLPIEKQVVADHEIIDYNIIRDNRVIYHLPDVIYEKKINTDDISSILYTMDIDDMNNMGYNGQDVTVAVIDSGINFDHEVFANTNIIYYKSFVNTTYGYSSDEDTNDNLGHGTSTASLVVGNSATFKGAAPDANLVVVKVASGSGIITSAGLIAAIEWVASLEEVDIVTMSLSEPEEGVTEDPLENAVRRLVDSGKIVFMSAGNSGVSASIIDYFTMGSPSASPQVITVGATNNYVSMASFSSNGPTTGWEAKPDLVAPGTSIPVADKNGGYSSSSGTSFSTPLTAGGTAVLLSALKANNIIYNPGMIKSLLANGARTLNYNWAQQGNGHVNISRSWEIANDQNEYSSVFPEEIPFIDRDELPAGEILDIKVTLTANRGSWSIKNVSDSVKNIVKTEFIKLEYTNLYSQVATIRIEPPENAPTGLYEGNIYLNTPDGGEKSIYISITIKPPADYSILIDLLHSPWDSVMQSAYDGRLDRFYGRDAENMITEFRSKNIWVYEILSGDLTTEILSRYDALWLPSAFELLSPSYFDHDVSRDTILKSGELLAISQFISQGGDIILDFGGTSIYDGEFERTTVDEQSIKSLLSILGVKTISTIGDDLSNLLTNALNGSDMYNDLAPYLSRGGINYLSRGMPIFGTSTDTTAVGMFANNGARALIVNSRNWRDTTMDATVRDRLVNWIFAENGVQGLSYTQGDTSTVFKLKLIDDAMNNLTIKIYSVDYKGDRTAINYNFLTNINNSYMELSTPKITADEILFEIAYNVTYTSFSIWVDDNTPDFAKGGSVFDSKQIIDKLSNSGYVQWSVDIFNNNDFYKYQINVEITSTLREHFTWEYNPSSKRAGVVSIRLLSSAVNLIKDLEDKQLFNANVTLIEYNNKMTSFVFEEKVGIAPEISSDPSISNKSSIVAKTPFYISIIAFPILLGINRSKFVKN